MSLIQPTGNPRGAITSAEVKTNGPERPVELTDEGALRLVVQDAERAEMYLQNNSWRLFWKEIDILYQSPRTTMNFENGTATRSNVSRFTVAKHVNTLVPMIMSGIFYDSPPFMLRPRPTTTQETCRAKTALFSALLEEMEFKTECERGIDCQVLNGTGVWMYGWEEKTEIKKKFVRKTAAPKTKLPFTGETEVHTAESDEFEVKETKITKNRPFFEFCPLGTVLVSPDWRESNQIWKAKYIVREHYLTFEKLNQLRGKKGYVIPPEARLRELFFPPAESPQAPNTVQQQTASQTVHHAEQPDQKVSENPLETALKVQERWDKNCVRVVVQGKLLIRNEEHGFGRIPALSANFWNIQNAGWGLGTGRLVGSDQRVEQGATNGALDILAFSLNPSYARSRGANVQAQQIRTRLAGIVDVDGDIDKAFKLIETPKVPPEIWPVIQNAKQSSESTTGADEAMAQGTMPQKGGSSIGRTATGAGNLAAANATRIQGPVGRFVDNVFIQFLCAMDEMICERMPASEIRQIIGDEIDDPNFKLDMDNFLNARVKIEVLAGAHLAAKKAMAQALPLLIQIFENPHMLDSLNKMGYTVDIKELFNMLCEISEWKNQREVIRKMSKEEADMYKAATQGQAQAKLQNDIAVIGAKHQATTEEIDQKAEAKLAQKLTETAVDRAGGYVERQIVEHAMQPQALGTKDAQYTSVGAQ